jgi:hypothetical protein
VLESPFSREPVDLLIRKIIRGARRPEMSDADRIVARMSTAPFDDRLFRVSTELRDLTTTGYDLHERESSLTLHVVRRVAVEQQWAPGTSPDDYLDDLRRATLHSGARVGVYWRRGGHIAVTASATEAVVSLEHRGISTLPFTLVVYSADRGAIVSGYQFSDWSMIAIPGDAKWLR